MYTIREVEILQLISNGCTDRKMAKELKLSIHTIRTHRKNILKKSGEHTMMQVVKRCILEKIIS